jgi:hypothetical protein
LEKPLFKPPDTVSLNGISVAPVIAGTLAPPVLAATVVVAAAAVVVVVATVVVVAGAVVAAAVVVVAGAVVATAALVVVAAAAGVLVALSPQATNKPASAIKTTSNALNFLKGFILNLSPYPYKHNIKCVHNNTVGAGQQTQL